MKKEIEIVNSFVERVTIEKNCAVVIKTNDGVEITMYGEIIDGKIIKPMTRPSFWNKKLYSPLSMEERIAINEAVEKELEKYI
jgi:hypothetical protein